MQPNSATPQTPETPSQPSQPATPSQPNDATAMAKRLGEIETENKQLLKSQEEFKKYKEQVDPVLETLWSDQELLQKATETHNRRLGKSPVQPKSPEDKSEPGKQEQVSPGQRDMRNSQVNLIHERFEEKMGISKLEPEKQKEVRGLVGQMIKEMLDPNNNKTITQVYEDVSLSKLPWYLERSYDAVTKDDQIKAAVEGAKNEVLSQYSEQVGAIGSMPSSSASAESTTLTPQERKVAANMGVSDEDYLKQKKEINDVRNRG